jgi:hypothetical protein
VSFWTGLVTVFAFSQGRFAEKQVDVENIDPPLPARYFTSRFRYFSSALVFAGAYVILYVCLIVLGSLPALQDVLKPLFGSLTGSGAPAGDTAQSADIGTPAWAAMVMMVIAPTVPWIKRIERSFRLWLQEFSDTPFKARGLADELIHSMLVSVGAPPRLEDASEAELAAAFERLSDLRQELTASGRNKSDQNYREFFAEQGEILTTTVNLFRKVQDETVALPKGARRARASAQNEAPARLVVSPTTHRMQMVILVRRFARLIACSLLYAESEEFAVRERLRTMPHLANFPRASFQFTIAQVFLALFMIALVTVVSGPVTSIITNLSSGAVVMPDQLIGQIGEWAARGVVLAIAFVLPLCLVAAIRLYLIDMALHGRGELGWHETLMMLLLAFIGCYGLSALPLVAFEAYKAGNNFNSATLFTALLWAVPPAIVNSALVKLSDIRWSGATARNALFDFVLFAAIGGAAAILAAAGVALTYLQGARDFTGFTLLFSTEIPFMFTVALVSGLNGALQSGASRVVTSDAHARAATRQIDASALSGAVSQPTS